MRVPDQSELLEVDSRVVGALVAELTRRGETPQRVEHFDVDEVGSVQVGVPAEALDHARSRLAGDESIKHG